ncbi:hypothetical protein PDJAM_G00232810 [Pangasius djambal]|uniref:Uncharacterized protein n=1 Tax=Pangasius djambal TaxID=1691987 RepID=A0ACC5YEJ9_9TELE|nr:hypothetical protein [Pangasius djambal]
MYSCLHLISIFNILLDFICMLKFHIFHIVLMTVCNKNVTCNNFYYSSALRSVQFICNVYFGHMRKLRKAGHV